MEFTPTVLKPNFYPTFFKIFPPVTLYERAFYELPVHSNSGDYRFTTEIGGVRLTFDFVFNRRLNKWAMTITDADTEEVIVAGRAIVNGIDLIGQYSDERLPVGSIIAINTDENGHPGEDAGEYDLGDRVKVYYSQLEATTE